jgi:hypothetical protein
VWGPKFKPQCLQIKKKIQGYTKNRLVQRIPCIPQRISTWTTLYLLTPSLMDYLEQIHQVILSRNNAVCISKRKRCDWNSILLPWFLIIVFSHPTVLNFSNCLKKELVKLVCSELWSKRGHHTAFGCLFHVVFWTFLLHLLWCHLTFSLVSCLSYKLVVRSQDLTGFTLEVLARIVRRGLTSVLSSEGRDICNVWPFSCF